MDDYTFTTSILGRGRDRRGCGRGVFVESSSLSEHEEVVGGTPLLQAMAEAMRDVARAIHNEIPPPLPHSPKRETSCDPIEVKFRRYIKDLRDVIRLCF